MFQQLYHAVSYWEKLLGRSPTPTTVPSRTSTPVPCADVRLKTPVRRMTIPNPSIHVLEYESHCQVVMLDPLCASNADLDDISQPDNGMTVDADAEISASDSESEVSAKEDEFEQIKETPYVSNENEVLGSVRAYPVSPLIQARLRITGNVDLIELDVAGWGGRRRAAGRTEVSHLVPNEAAATRHGSLQSRSAYFHPRAEVLLGKTRRLLLSRRPLVAVSQTFMRFSKSH